MMRPPPSEIGCFSLCAACKGGDVAIIPAHIQSCVFRNYRVVKYNPHSCCVIRFVSVLETNLSATTHTALAASQILGQFAKPPRRTWASTKNITTKPTL